MKIPNIENAIYNLRLNFEPDGGSGALKLQSFNNQPATDQHKTKIKATGPPTPCRHAPLKGVIFIGYDKQKKIILIHNKINI